MSGKRVRRLIVSIVNSNLTDRIESARRRTFVDSKLRSAQVLNELPIATKKLIVQLSVVAFEKARRKEIRIEGTESGFFAQPRVGVRDRGIEIRPNRLRSAYNRRTQVSHHRRCTEGLIDALLK